MRQTSIALREGLENPFYSKHTTAQEFERPDPITSKDIAIKTAEALQSKIANGIKISHHPNTAAFLNKETSHIVKYIQKDNEQEKFIKITPLQTDPLQPPKYKHKRIPPQIPSPPHAVMHSPPRKLTAKDQQDWKIPPCNSNWKNSKGYTIPLHMRLQADGRNLIDTTIGKRFAPHAEALYIAERQARKEIEERNKLQQSLHMMRSLRMEKEMLEAASEAHHEKAAIIATNISSLPGSEHNLIIGKRENADTDINAAMKERDAIRIQRKKEIERDRRMEVAGKKKNKSARDEDRDISEALALGQSQISSKDNIFDHRLFNQTTAADTGIADNNDEDD